VGLARIACPSCGTTFTLAIDETESYTSTDSEAQILNRHLGHFELVEQLGCGAFGTVWKATDVRLDRTVAIKIPRRGIHSDGDVQMFLREARAAAQIRHANIVSVHEVGSEDDVVYIVSDFVDGLSLKDWLLDKLPTSQESAHLCVKIAEALHHAHESGIVHRDLKPANIMIDKAGEPHVMDFGIAKRDAGEVTVTLEGQILGTPAYMSPEQAKGEGHTADRRSDVYSLGVILYELLTSERPFRGNTSMLLKQVLEDVPIEPRRLNSSVPRDLETVCMKCLQKDPRSRYASTRELADELRRFLAGEPIQARRISRPARFWRWCKRRPLVAGLSTSLFAALLIGSIISIRFAVTANQKASEAAESAHLASQNAESLSLAMTQLEWEKTEVERQRDRAEGNLYVSNIELARRHIVDGSISHADRILEACPLELRQWEWGYLKRLCHLELLEIDAHPGSAIWAIDVSPDGQRIVSGAQRDDKGVLVWDAETGTQTLQLSTGGIGVVDVDYSPDGKWIAAVIQGTGTVHIWDAQSGVSQRVLKMPDQDALCVAFGPHGRRLALGGHQGAIRVYDMESGAESLAMEKSKIEEWLVALRFSPDGTKLASQGRQMFQLWDADSGQLIRTLAVDPVGVLTYGPSRLAFSPNGHRIATASPQIRIFDVESGDQVLEIASAADHLSISPDGEVLAGSSDGRVKIWDADNGQELETISGLHMNRDLAFLPDSERIVTAGAGLAVWRLDESKEAFELPTGSPASSLVFNGNSATFLSGAPGFGAVRYDTWTGEKLLELPSPYETLKSFPAPRNMPALAFSGDGRRMADLAPDGVVYIRDTVDGREIGHFTVDDRSICINMGPRGDRVVVGTHDACVDIHDVQSGARLHRFEANTPWLTETQSTALRVWLEKALDAGGAKASEAKQAMLSWQNGHGIVGVALSPDARRVAAIVRTQVFKVWDVNTGAEHITVDPRADDPVKKPANTLSYSPYPHWITFSPNGDTIATARFAAVILWDASTGERRGMLAGHSKQVTAASFNANGRRLFSSSDDATVKVWDIVTGRELISLPASDGLAFAAVSISPNQRHLIGSTKDGKLKLWDAVASDDPSFPRRVKRPAPQPDARTTYGFSPAPSPEIPVTELAFDNLKRLEIATKPVQEVFPRIVNYYGPRTLQLVRQPDEMLQVEPKYASEQPLYASLRLGKGTDRLMTVAVDEADGERPRVYIDRNNDEDLTNDDTGSWPTHVAPNLQMPSCVVDVPYGDRTGLYTVGLYRLPDRSPDVLYYYRNTAREFRLRVAGQNYWALLLDDNADGCFDDVENTSLFLVAGTARKPCTQQNRIKLTDPFEIASKQLKVTSISVDGATLELHLFSPQRLLKPGTREATDAKQTLTLEPLEVRCEYGEFLLDLHETPCTTLEGQGYSAVFPRGIWLDDVPKEELSAEPTFHSRSPQYGALLLGNGPDPYVTVALDATNEGQTYLYIDSNNDEDLTNDGPAEVPRKSVSSYRRDNEVVETVRYYVEGKTVEVPYAENVTPYTLFCHWTSPRARRRTFLSLRNYLARQCWFEYENKVYWLMVFSENAEARFDDPDTTSIFVKQGDKSSHCDWDEAVRPGEPLTIGDSEWAVTSLAASGTRLTLSPFSFQDVSFDQLENGEERELTVQLRPRTATFGGVYNLSNRYTIQLVDEPLEELRDEPTYKSRKPRYSALHAGTGSDALVTVVLEPMEEEPPNLYIDANNDEDLTNDGPAQMYLSGSSVYRQENRLIDTVYGSGIIRQRFWFSYAPEQRPEVLTYGGCAGRQAFLRWQGREYWCFVATTDGCGVFDNLKKVSIVVAEGRKSCPVFQKNEAVQGDAAFQFGNRTWRISSLSPDGLLMKLNPVGKGVENEKTLEAGSGATSSTIETR
jgi:WD40 repeat protein/serine/threonine protein kinase